MKLEDAIQQKNFRSIQQKTYINLLYTYYWLTDKVKDIFKKFDITPQQYNVLRILRGSLPNPLSPIQIRERMLDKMSDTSRLVSRLEKKGLVVKNVSFNDKRFIDVLISEKGLELLKKMEIIENEIDNLFNGLTEQELEQLNQWLDKIKTCGLF
jgi:DNA-binding MarR family transcriptional regulator